MVARVKKICVLLACVILCGTASNDPLERSSSEENTKPGTGMPISSRPSSRTKSEGVQPALMMVAASVAYHVLLPVASAGLPPAAGVALLASGVVSIGGPFLLPRGGGKAEDAGVRPFGGADKEGRIGCAEETARLEREVKKERGETEKAKERAKKAEAAAEKAKIETKKAKEAAKRADAETAVAQNSMAIWQRALRDAYTVCKLPGNATIFE